MLKEILFFFLIPVDVSDVKNTEVLINELKSFNPELMDKDYIVALTKCDLLDNELKGIFKIERKL